MSTLEFSKNCTLRQTLWLTIVSLLLISVCQRNDEANASGEWPTVAAINPYRATSGRGGNGLVSWQSRQFTMEDSRAWQRLLIKNKSQEIERPKEEKGGDDAFTKQLQQMEKNRKANERAKFIPTPSTQMQPNKDKLSSKKMGKAKEGNKKDDMSPKLVR